MDIMEDFLRYRDLKYLRLDGSTKPDDRSDMLKKFNAPDSEYFMFILSTRAGGLGLNLQTADTVIIFDSDWNPHQDLQAQDRAHRIGQKVEVRVLRLITEKSVEEKMLEIAHRKLDMDGKVIQAGRFDNNATNEERDTMLRAMLEAAEDDDEEDSGELTNEELNQILARSEAEEERFKEMDAEREKQEIAEWRAQGKKGTPPDRLITEDELPSHFQSAFEEELEAYKEQEEEPTVRKRAVVNYRDDLTEEQFLNAVDSGQDITEVMEAKRERAERRRLKALARAEGTSASATPEPGKRGRKGKNRDETPEQSPAPVGRKRKRIGGTETPEPESFVSSRGGKKRRGADNDTEDQIANIRQALLTCYQAIATAKEPETGRLRSGIFIDLPDKTDYPDYYTIIQQPICMKQIKRKITKGYKDVKSCRDDVHLMFNNARTYNQEGSWVWTDAQTLQEVWDSTYDSIVVGSGLPGSEEAGAADTADNSFQADDDDTTTNGGGSSRATPALASGAPSGRVKLKLSLGKRKPAAPPTDDGEDDEDDD